MNATDGTDATTAFISFY